MANNKISTKELGDWFMGKAKTAAGYRKKIIGNTDRSVDYTVIGRMYFFWYDPKYKNILPIYDRFPMVFPIERYPDGFLGLNLHYLNLKERKQLLYMLESVSGNQTMNTKTKLKISYDILSQFKSLKTLANPCIKRYLYSHVMSQFVEITPDEWEKAANLPVEAFVRKK